MRSEGGLSKGRKAGHAILLEVVGRRVRRCHDGAGDGEKKGGGRGCLSAPRENRPISPAPA